MSVRWRPTKSARLWGFEINLQLTTKQFSVDFSACTSKIFGNIGYNRAQGADMYVSMTRDRHPMFGALIGSSQHHVTAFLSDEPVAVVPA